MATTCHGSGANWMLRRYLALLPGFANRFIKPS